MKKLLVLLLICGFITACEEKKNDETNLAVSEQTETVDLQQTPEVLFFTKNMCPYCNHAAAYLSTHYSDLPVTFIDIETSDGWKRFLETVDTLQLDTQQLGTPLIVIGKQYILGWSPAEQEKLDIFLKPLLK